MNWRYIKVSGGVDGIQNLGRELGKNFLLKCLSYKGELTISKMQEIIKQIYNSVDAKRVLSNWGENPEVELNKLRKQLNWIKENKPTLMEYIGKWYASVKDKWYQDRVLTRKSSTFMFLHRFYGIGGDELIKIMWEKQYVNFNFDDIYGHILNEHGFTFWKYSDWKI